MQTLKGGDRPTEGPSVDPSCTMVVDPTLTVQ